jgi:hypothetical protein
MARLWLDCDWTPEDHDRGDGREQDQTQHRRRYPPTLARVRRQRGRAFVNLKSCHTDMRKSTTEIAFQASP